MTWRHYPSGPQRWVLWVILYMFIGGLLFFLYWKLEIEPEKKRNCQRDQHGDCLDDDSSHDPRMGARQGGYREQALDRR
jgi:hypothetical protein